jgi:hypothetical protein
VAVYTVFKRSDLLNDRDKLIYYKESISNTFFKLETKLEPKTRYLWSVRLRQADGKVSHWSTYNKKIDVGFYTEVHGNRWFGIKTPSVCESNYAE